MLRTAFFAACLAIVPAVAFGVGSGMGLYGTASFGGGGGGDAHYGTGKEDYDAAIRMMDKQEYEDAVPHLLRALHIQQGNADILNDLGYATRMAGNYSDSVDYLQRAIARKPELTAAYVNLGEDYLATHQPEQAKLQLDALKRLCPGGCGEEDTLGDSIASYDAKAKAAAASGPAAGPNAQGPSSQK